MKKNQIKKNNYILPKENEVNVLFFVNNCVIKGNKTSGISQPLFFKHCHKQNKICKKKFKKISKKILF